ncbi:MAG: rhodanese-like domain-containing protein [Thiohalomonadales bacterium]
MFTKSILRSIIWIILLVCSTQTQAEKTPNDLSGSIVVDAEDVIALVSQFPDIVIIDSRIPGDRLLGYIEGSISLPDVNTDCARLAAAIPNKKFPTLFYCNGINCGRSANAINIAVKCGYEKIYWFRGGFIEWKAKGYPFLQK